VRRAPPDRGRADPGRRPARHGHHGQPGSGRHGQGPGDRQGRPCPDRAGPAQLVAREQAGPTGLQGQVRCPTLPPAHGHGLPGRTRGGGQVRDIPQVARRRHLEGLRDLPLPVRAGQKDWHDPALVQPRRGSPRDVLHRG